jgi:hypothetical protein
MTARGTVCMCFITSPHVAQLITNLGKPLTRSALRWVLQLGSSTGERTQRSPFTGRRSQPLRV